LTVELWAVGLSIDVLVPGSIFEVSIAEEVCVVDIDDTAAGDDVLEPIGVKVLVPSELN
jgi:hypothetical protein